ncbi:MAG: ATP-binding protein [Campylobacterota bacterium]|nr:ATP-binding protein [Campylobacterota bacterium]
MPLEEENHSIEYKSLDKTEGKSKLKDLARECVCFANAQGGTIFIGLDDKTKKPPSSQKVSQDKINTTLKALRGFTNSVGLAEPIHLVHENGGEYFSFRVLPSLKTVAMTSDGKVAIRIGEECLPVDSQSLTQLVSEKGDFQWELVRHTRMTLDKLPLENIQNFISDIRSSDKVSEFIKQLDDNSLLEHFRLVDEGAVTNLGLLWLGNHLQRSKVSYPITVQYIVYDKNEEKIRKEEWHFNQLNPKELLLDIENRATELKYFYELPKGLFREKIPQYHPDVIRELLVNAFVHQSYTISGDIFIRIYTDRFEIMNPGGLPLGITKENILHHTRRKNPHMIDIFKALGLMEGEGSGYDKIYEKLSLDAKLFPEIDNDIDYVKVTIFSTIISQDILKLLDYVLSHFELTQKEIIALGVIAREKKVSTTELSKLLQLGDDIRVRAWVNSLVEKKILLTQGKTKGLTYLINPELLSTVDQNIKPSLKTIEPHVLKALIYEDLKIHPNSSKSDIVSRLPDIDVKEIQKFLYSGIDSEELIKYGATKNRTYLLANKKEIKKK